MLLQSCSLRFKKLLRCRGSYHRGYHRLATCAKIRMANMANAGTSSSVQYSVVTVCSLCVIVLLTMISSLQDPTVHVATRFSLPVLWSTPVRGEYLNMWCMKYCDDSVVPAQVLSKELIVRRVFFDNRTKPGKHSNATVFLVEAKGNLRPKCLFGCRVGRYVSKVFLFRKPVSYKWVQRHKNANSTLALIECYDIPVVKNGDSASLFYKSYPGFMMEIQSLKPLLVPEPKAEVDSPAVTAVVCVGMVRSGEHSPSQDGMIYHWLRYQKALGVDHVHMAVEDSFVQAGGLQNYVIQQAVRDGYVSIDFWPHWLSSKEVYNSQKLAYQDCLYRFQGVYDYIIYADSDDFFVPVSTSKSIKHYLKTWCSGMTASCRFTWRQYFPDCGWDPNSVGADGNFTAALTYKHTADRNEHKSGHQLRALVDAGTHEAKILLDGYTQVDVPVTEAYMAHLRFGLLPIGGC